MNEDGNVLNRSSFSLVVQDVMEPQPSPSRKECMRKAREWLPL